MGTAGKRQRFAAMDTTRPRLADSALDKLGMTDDWEGEIGMVKWSNGVMGANGSGFMVEGHGVVEWAEWSTGVME
jgi:hypothetical protein